MISKIYMTSTRKAQHNTISPERDIQKWVVGMRERVWNTISAEREWVVGMREREYGNAVR